MTDPIADMLTRIRNASKARKAEVFIPFSKMKLEIIKILKKYNYITDFKEIKPNTDGYKFGGLLVTLSYSGKESSISAIRRISKPGQRVYRSKDDLPRVLGGLGIAVISTSKGIMTNKEARRSGLGGEIICEIY